MDSKNQKFRFGLVNYLLAIEWEGFEIWKKLASYSEFFKEREVFRKDFEKRGKTQPSNFFLLFLLSELN